MSPISFYIRIYVYNNLLVIQYIEAYICLVGWWSVEKWSHSQVWSSQCASCQVEDDRKSKSLNCRSDYFGFTRKWRNFSQNLAIQWLEHSNYFKTREISGENLICCLGAFIYCVTYFQKSSLTTTLEITEKRIFQSFFFFFVWLILNW